MTPEKQRAHAHLARQLVRDSGGLAEAAAHCRLEKSRLQEFTDPTKDAQMDWGVIDDLELHCGQTGRYYRALADMAPGQLGTESLQEESCELTETVARLQAVVRKSKGCLTEHQRREVCTELLSAEQHIGRVWADAQRGRS